LTERVVVRILICMSRVALLVALLSVTAVVGLAKPQVAGAGWCWPSCSSYGLLGGYTSTYNGCWFTWGEVCSGWSYWSLNGVSKTCYPGCDYWGYTKGEILFGFENTERIRGYFSWVPGTKYVRPADVAMGGYLRAQVAYWAGTPSQINAAAVG
jgi:hypothetical protein